MRMLIALVKEDRQLRRIAEENELEGRDLVKVLRRQLSVLKQAKRLVLHSRNKTVEKAKKILAG